MSELGSLCEDRPLNFYGQPITAPEYFDGRHIASPGPAGLPPVCSCGWTRWQIEDGPCAGEWFEMIDHLRDMGEFAR